MKKTPIEYVVMWCGREVGRTMAVSEAQAINNYRFTNGGPLEMFKEGSKDGYSAISAILLEFRQNNAISEKKRKAKHEDPEQMRLPYDG